MLILCRWMDLMKTNTASSAPTAPPAIMNASITREFAALSSTAGNLLQSKKSNAKAANDTALTTSRYVTKGIMRSSNLSRGRRALRVIRAF